MKNISTIKWSNLTDPGVLKKESSWIIPQLSALLGTGLTLKKNDKGLMSFKQSFLAWRDSNDLGSIGTTKQSDLKGMLNYINTAPRGTILFGTQTKQPASSYNSGVPLLLAAFKKYRNINYMDWDWSEGDSFKRAFLDEDLLEFTSIKEVPEFTPEELLELQDIALEKSNNVNPEACYRVFRSGNAQFDALPRLVRLALIQCWVYSPKIRNEYMITRFDDFDKPAEPLVPTHITQEEDIWGNIKLESSAGLTEPKAGKKKAEIPWIDPWSD